MIPIGTAFDEFDFIVHAFEIAGANRIVCMVQNTILKETQLFYTPRPARLPCEPGSGPGRIVVGLGHARSRQMYDIYGRAVGNANPAGGRSSPIPYRHEESGR